ncbi:hypothetical protein CDAR_24761 [Caerostris darwini]|uniref:Secreted protein n=1 Tax=Caerostris darwini TaxID=1538125 RepID=A0AAV4P9I4_9ARAC|nr:hypothetical protein CDAR_24761 [Caerostris darwini]
MTCSKAYEVAVQIVVVTCCASQFAITSSNKPGRIRSRKIRYFASVIRDEPADTYAGIGIYLQGTEHTFFHNDRTRRSWPCPYYSCYILMISNRTNFDAHEQTDCGAVVWKAYSINFFSSSSVGPSYFIRSVYVFKLTIRIALHVIHMSTIQIRKYSLSESKLSYRTPPSGI